MIIFAAVWCVGINRDGGVCLVAIVGDGGADIAVTPAIEEEELA